LKRIAAEGPRAFYEGAIAADIVRVVNEHPRNPGTLSTQDIADFRVRERAPLCAPYREWRICGMAPPSSGATTVLQILKLLEPLPMRAQAPDSLMAAHLFTEAGRLAYADRARYLGDPDFVSVPVRALLDERYLDSRRAQIDPRRTLGRASAGQPERLRVARIDGQTQEEASTTHLSVVDADGNAVALSSSIESAFGSRVMAAGFLLNNQLTDFAFAPRDADGVLANRVEPRKRPRSSMAPTMVFDRSGRLVLVIGSPGGTWIIPYVAKTLVGVLDWQLSLQAAIDLPHVATPNGPTFLERGTRAEALKGPLELLGHEVRVIDMTSGLHGIHRVGDRWVSGADPRREGIGRGE
jgi:gamma-glutamyltranspeptidase/glutathione hydrolase